MIKNDTLRRNSIENLYHMKLGPEKLKFINEKDDEKDLKDESKLDGSETPEMQLCFKNLQAFSACFDAFAHGGNDVG